MKTLVESIARDVSQDGQLVFPNNDSATNFIKNMLVKSISKIELRWHNIRIDPLTTGLPGVSANYHEDISDNAGKKITEEGYFTAIAGQGSSGWQLRNAHWSVIPAK